MSDKGVDDKVINLEDRPLTKKEKLDIYAKALCDGHTKIQAYVIAGYSERTAALNVYKYHRDNAEYINAYMSEHIGSHAPMALKIVLKIMNDENEKGGIRLKAAQDVLDRAGFGAKQKVELTTVDVKDMNTEELQGEIKRILEEDPNLAKVFQFPKLSQSN